MKKVRSLSKEKIDEISALIGASFWDFPYEPGEGGYVHLGMKLVQTRTAAGCKIYDLMYCKKGVN